MPLIEKNNNLLEKTVLTPEQYGILTTANAVYCTSKYADLTALSSVVGSASCTLVIDSAVTISANTTLGTGGILTGAKIVVYGTGSFAVASGKTLTINSPFSCGLFQCFALGDATSRVVFGSGAVSEVYPEWWGADSSASASINTVAINAAIACVRANAKGGKVLISQLYNVTSIDISSATADYEKHTTIEGIGPFASGFVGTDPNSIVVDTIGSNYINLNYMSISGVGKIGLLRARSTTSVASSAHTSRNLRVEGSWSIAAVVCIASESNSDYDPWWGTAIGAGSVTAFITSPFNSLGIISTHGTIQSSSNTDNRIYGGAIYCYAANAIVMRWIDSAQYAMYGTAVTNGAEGNGVLNQYELSGSSGNTFVGPITWNDCLFEGGNAVDTGVGNPIVHYLKGRPGLTNAFYHINSYGGYYNLYDIGANQNVITYDSTSGTTAILVDSDFTKARFNPSSEPFIALYAAESCNIDMNSRGTSTLTISSYQGPGEFKAGTVNYAPVNNMCLPQTFGTTAPISGTYGAGHIVWNTNSGTIAEGKLGWKCIAAGTPGTWMPIYTSGTAMQSYANNAAALSGGLTAGCFYKANGTGTAPIGTVMVVY